MPFKHYTIQKKVAFKLLKEAPALVILNEDYYAFSPPLQFIWLLLEIHPSYLQGRLLKGKVTFKNIKRCLETKGLFINKNYAKA